MAIQNVSKKEVDNLIFELLKLEEDKKKIDKRIKEIKSFLESQYTLDDNKKEYIYGDETYIEKIPVNNGRNTYDAQKLKPYLRATRSVSKVIKKVEVVDLVELNKLVEIGKLPVEVLDKCRVDKWTFKSIFKRMENTIKGKSNKDDKSA